MDDRAPAFGLRPPVQVNALPDDHPRVREQVARIAALSTRRHEYADDGSFRQWIQPFSASVETPTTGRSAPRLGPVGLGVSADVREPSTGAAGA